MMREDSDDYPIGTGSVIWRVLKLVCFVVVGFVALIYASCVWGHHIPYSENVRSFNRWYKTHIPSRQINYYESGFVDTEFFAAIPMTEQEFMETVREIGMTLSPSKSRLSAHRGPWWFKDTDGEVYLLDRTQNQNHRDYIEGFYNPKRKRGYFHYFDH